MAFQIFIDEVFELIRLHFGFGTRRGLCFSGEDLKDDYAEGVDVALFCEPANGGVFGG